MQAVVCACLDSSRTCLYIRCIGGGAALFLSSDRSCLTLTLTLQQAHPGARVIPPMREQAAVPALENVCHACLHYLPLVVVPASYFIIKYVAPSPPALVGTLSRSLQRLAPSWYQDRAFLRLSRASHIHQSHLYPRLIDCEVGASHLVVLASCMVSCQRQERSLLGRSFLIAQSHLPSLS